MVCVKLSSQAQFDLSKTTLLTIRGTFENKNAKDVNTLDEHECIMGECLVLTNN